MPSEQIRANATVIEIMTRDAYRVELANGHRAIARPARENAAAYQPGDQVSIEFHPYDLSRGRIVG